MDGGGRAASGTAAEEVGQRRDRLPRVRVREKRRQTKQTPSLTSDSNGTYLSLNVGWVSVFCVTHQALHSNTTPFLMSAWRHIGWVTAQTACLTHPCMIKFDELWLRLSSKMTSSPGKPSHPKDRQKCLSLFVDWLPALFAHTRCVSKASSLYTQGR